MKHGFQFQVGDRVVAFDTVAWDPVATQGMTGTVCVTAGSFDCGVRFDENIGGHDCAGKCKYGYGWYVHSDRLALIEEPIDINTNNITDLL